MLLISLKRSSSFVSHRVSDNREAIGDFLNFPIEKLSSVYNEQRLKHQLFIKCEFNYSHPTNNYSQLIEYSSI